MSSIYEEIGLTKDDLKNDILSVRNAIIEIASGSRVVQITIAGKTTEYQAADFEDLKTLQSTLIDDYKNIDGSNSGQVFRVQTSKGV